MLVAGGEAGAAVQQRGGFWGGMDPVEDWSVLREPELPSRETGGFKLCW